MEKITFSKVKDTARGRWGGILSALGGGDMADAIARGSARHGACPVHGGKKPFRVFKDVEATGGSICSQCGGFNDGFAFLQELYNWSSSEVLSQVATHLGMKDDTIITVLPPRKIIATQEITPAEIERRKQSIQKLWKNSVPMNDTRADPMMRYLLNRGIQHLDVIPNGSIKMSLSHGYYDDEKETMAGHYSVMVAPVFDPKGICVALHRTYLTATGKKAPVECAKKLLTKGTSLKGAAIRLFPAMEEMGVCEGIETALAVNQMNGMSVWPCVSASLLRQVELPSVVKRLHIWADKDLSEAGQQAAEALSEIQYELGVEVTIHTPEQKIPTGSKSIDWLDVHNLHSTPERLRRTA